jgi:hypothetical protein
LAAEFAEEGRIADAAAVWHRTAVDAGHPATAPEPPSGKARRFIKGVLQSTAFIEASRGNAEIAEQAFRAQQMHPLGARAGPDASKPAALALNPLADAREAVRFKLLRGNYDAVIADGRSTLDQLRSLLTGPATTPHDRVLFRSILEPVRESLAEALIQRGRFAEAETMLQTTRDLQPPNQPPYTTTQRIWLALALARLERREDALATLAPALSTLERKPGAGPTKHEQRELLARALFVTAVAQPMTELGRKMRAEALGEAQKIFEGMTAEARQLHNARALLRWIAEEQARG